VVAVELDILLQRPHLVDQEEEAEIMEQAHLEHLDKAMLVDQVALVHPLMLEGVEEEQVLLAYLL